MLNLLNVGIYNIIRALKGNKKGGNSLITYYSYNMIIEFDINCILKCTLPGNYFSTLSQKQRGVVDLTYTLTKKQTVH